MKTKVFLVLVAILAIVLSNCGRDNSEESGTLVIFVKDKNANPVEKAKITISGRDLSLSRETDSSGKAAFYLEKGSFQIKVSKDQFSEVTLLVDVAPNTETKKEIVLYKKGVGDLKVIVLDEAKKPLSDAKVTVGTQEENTDINGEAFFLDILVAEYEICASKDGYLDAKTKIATEEKKMITATVTLALYIPKGKIEGKVLDSQDKSPVAGATLTLGTAVTTSTESGEFCFEKLPAGEYALTCSAKNYKEQSELIVLGKDETKSVDFLMESTLPGVLEGRVVDKVTGKGIVEATIVIASLNYTTWTGADGGYQIKNIPAGEYDAIATAGYYTSATAKVKISARTTSTQNFILMPTTGSLRGQLLRDSSAPCPIAGARINEDVDPQGYILTNESGNYYFEHLPARTVSFEVYAQNNLGTFIHWYSSTLNIEAGKENVASPFLVHKSFDNFEPNETPAAACEIAKGETKNACVWSLEDVDYYFFNQNSSGACTIEFSVAGAKNVNYELEVLDSNLQKIGQLEVDSELSATASFSQSLPTGKYFIKIFSKTSWNKFDVYLLKVE